MDNSIDNTLYNREGDIWRQPDSPFYLMQCSVNPARLGFFKRKLVTELNINPQGKSALEVGCGGGILAKEIALMGFAVTGIDPSEQSIRMAADHANASGLRINYDTGIGEALPYRDGAFDVVFCCDVLEHVCDLPKVISEISRVLKPGGIFCYDTLNRTLLSKLVAIDISQHWKRWAFAPPNLHVWKMFIKPDELKSLLGQNNLEWKEHRGMGPNVSLPKLLRLLRKRARGRLTYKEMGGELYMVESRTMSIMYMGYAVKYPRYGIPSGER
jgi:2-polyprenyl-6-hydroxyphenyl methylase/3-demethylubiquinone-9 3-methyltransferase